MMEVWRRNVFRAYFIIVISFLRSAKEYTFTDSSGTIGSPVSHEIGQFTYKIFVPQFGFASVRVQSVKLNLSKRVQGMGCDKNYITVSKEGRRVDLPRFCDEDEIDEYFRRGPIYITFTKVTDSRTYFNISYKACSYISSDPLGTFVIEEELNRPFSLCYFKINITTSLIVTSFGRLCYGSMIYGPDDKEITHPRWTFPETYFIRNGPLRIYRQCDSRHGKTLIAKYTTVSEDYLSQEYTAQEGKFEPLLFYNKYANRANYTFTIRSDYGGKVLVYFQNIDIGDCDDVIRVNGVVLCENNASTVTISDEVAKVSFATDDIVSGTGFEGYWTSCPRLFTNEAGNFSLDSPWNKLMPMGFNCSFIIKNTTNKILMLIVNIQYENDSTVDVSDKSADIVEIKFHDENNLIIKTRITGVRNITSYGECIITYIAGDGAKLKFHASYISKNDHEGGNELEESKNMRIWLVLAVVLVALLLML